jgi:flagellar biosynthesis anti-sigma factor FlgM
MTSPLTPLGSSAQSLALADEVKSQPAVTTISSESATGTSATSEDVTLSETVARASNLTDVAQDSDGIDHALVAQIRNSIQSGNYNVSPEDLAQAIATVLKDSA